METCTCAEISATEALWRGSHCHIVITGASRGFGRAMCLQLVEQLSSGEDQPVSIKMLLMGRDLTALQETKAQVMARRNAQSSIELVVIIVHSPLDMTDARESTLLAALKPFFDLTSDNGGDGKRWNLLVHNAATLGNLKKRADERTSILEQDTYYRVNLTAPMILTSLFLQHFAPFGVHHAPTMVLNISSLAAAQPFPRMSDYCAGKAARQMYLQSLAVDRPSVAVFNYSPGPLDTDMYTQLAEDHGDERFRVQAAENKRSGRIIAPEESARVCVSWLRRFYVSTGPEREPKALICPVHELGWADIWRGSRLDYYDAVAMEKVTRVAIRDSV
ncbi:putative Ankyrin repeat-containing [Fasciola gigantica]|uniref:Putative Ankyrin repeat-containing n=1 Tax=Fasciola gigantica TaxID=46835 RepID=A0A504YIX4_FASGI|nr:putative Ankyrin repeat-containing [Fasciola gigantica]